MHASSVMVPALHMLSLINLITSSLGTTFWSWSWSWLQEDIILATTVRARNDELFVESSKKRLSVALRITVNISPLILSVYRRSYDLALSHGSPYRRIADSLYQSKVKSYANSCLVTTYLLCVIIYRSWRESEICDYFKFLLDIQFQ